MDNSKKRGRPATAPRVQPQNYITRDGLTTIYTYFTPKLDKDGNTVYYKNTQVKTSNPVRKTYTRKGARNMGKKKIQASALKRAVVANLDKYTIGELDTLIKIFTSKPEEVKTTILRQYAPDVMEA